MSLRNIVLVCVGFTSAGCETMSDIGSVAVDVIVIGAAIATVGLVATEVGKANARSAPTMVPRTTVPRGSARGSANWAAVSGSVQSSMRWQQEMEQAKDIDERVSSQLDDDDSRKPGAFAPNVAACLVSNQKNEDLKLNACSFTVTVFPHRSDSRHAIRPGVQSRWRNEWLEASVCPPKAEYSDGSCVWE